MRHKYVINDRNSFLIFSDSVIHADAAKLLVDAENRYIVGAGFIDMLDGEVKCYGYSSSLNIKSRQFVDAKAIAEKLGLKALAS